MHSRLVLSLCLTKDLILCTVSLCLTKANAFAQQVLHQVYSSLSIPSSGLFLLGPWFTECGSSGQVCCIRLGGVSPTEVRAEMQRVQGEQPFYTLKMYPIRLRTTVTPLVTLNNSMNPRNTFLLLSCCMTP